MDIDRSQLPPFQYTPLQYAHGQTRLVILHPGERQDDIVVSIDDVFINYARYNAVSYVWGCNDRTHPVYASYCVVEKREGAIHEYDATVSVAKQPSGIIMVTENLRNVLLSLRSTEDLVTLWIDSICINQEDLVEKAAQIKEMKSIFGMAGKTIIYIGEHCEAMSVAFLAIIALETLTAKPADELPSDLSDILPIKTSIKPPTGLGDWPYEIKNAWNALMAFLELPWFHRIWIVQEVVLSRDLVICTSQLHVPWQVFVRACKIVNRSEMHALDAGRVHVNIAIHLEEQRVAMRNFLDAAAKEEVPDDSDLVKALVVSNHFIPLQMRTRGCHATDPRDHVFALLGIAKGGGERLPEVDYTLTLTEVFTRMAYAWHITQKRQPFSWLACVCGSYNATDLPTWVPDWRRPWGIKTILYRESASEAPRASGSKGTEGCVVKFPELNTPLTMPLRLQIRGCKILTIKDVEVIKSSAGWKTARHAQLINKFPEPYPTTYLPYLEAFVAAVTPESPRDYELKLPREESFWSYRKAGPSSSRPRPVTVSELEAKAKESRQVRLVVRSEEGMSSPRVFVMNSGKRTVAETHYTQEQLYDHLPRIFRYDVVLPQDKLVRGRIWFITDDGFMGLTHELTQPGDVIVHFFGGATPFVLRKKRSEGRTTIWGFVGECFVLGLMNGEVNEGMPEDVIEDFVLE